MRQINRLLADIAAKQVIEESGLFDADWYGTFYTDLQADGKAELLQHYIRHGAAEGRRPSAVFDPQFYQAQFPDLDPATTNPLCHYVIEGEQAGAWPNPYFDPAEVSPALPAARDHSTLLHRYLRLGATNIRPSDRFDAAAYLAARPYLEQIGINPLVHHLRCELLAKGIAQRTDPQLACVGLHQLEPVSMQDGQSVYQITGNDPHFILVRKDGQPFEPGYYEIRFKSSASEVELRTAKAYFDYGEGYGEKYGHPLKFSCEPNGKRRAFLAIERPALRLRIDPRDHLDPAHPSFSMGTISLRKVGPLEFYLAAARNKVRTPRDLVMAGRNAVASLRDGGISALVSNLRGSAVRPQLGNDDYEKWFERYGTVTQDDRKAMRRIISTWNNPPLISVVMPTYNSPPVLLREALDSVLDQTYENWELCIADDASPEPHVKEILSEYAARDPRIKVVYRSENGHISASSNSALEIATGDWVALLDHDDLLTPHALFCMANAIIQNPEGRLFYSDEDKIDLSGFRFAPYFKCDWNPQLFLGHNLITHLGVYKRDIIEKIGGFRTGFEGAQDYDLALRFTSEIRDDQIIHLPYILYSWRVIPGSTAMAANEKPYAMLAGERALNEHMARNNIKAEVEYTGYGYRINYELPEDPPLVSIIIPTRNGLALTRACIESVTRLSDYPNYEILLVDNGSDDPEALEYFDKLNKAGTIRLIRDDRPFNYSALNNAAAKQAAGSMLCLLNNDIEVISPDWLSRMVAIALQPGTGAVGAKLLYPNDTIQHGGVVMGIGGVAGHVHHGLPRYAHGYFSRAILDQNLSAVTAACLVVSKEHFESVGGLNEEDLTIAFNDVDLCLKLTQLGLRNVWTAFAELYHHESVSRGYETTPEKITRFENETAYMQETWPEVIEHDPAYNPNLSLDMGSYNLSFPPRIKKPWKE